MRNCGMLAVAAGAALTLAGPAPAQVRGEVTLFSQPNQRGQTFVVRGSRNTLVIPWAVRSVRVARGEAWDLCTRTNHRDPCHRVAQDMANVNWRIASVRPSQVVTLPEPPSFAGSAGPSLRGMSAEFFTTPMTTGGRMPSCASGAAACTRQSADRFCRSHGWTAASYHRQETVRGTNFLADVLCTRTGG
ncbi:MAG: hypothetical protein MT490_15365 [Sphingomonas sp.]|uniref:hypothetical protein n=1 Tax=Sphingomonas sp. TaxID=28214 RepID=UPI0022728134|nr:hypothetical protein [Sphingomonas sp.]MCX8477166.1 hypothetical protein [Sphingomonas sp.]